MSRIGNLPISIPKEVEIIVSEKNQVTVKGPLGEMNQDVDSCLTMEIVQNDSNGSNSEMIVKRHTEEKKHKSMHGLYRSLIANMVEGVSKGYKKELELIGVGYRASNNGQFLELTLGYSHNIIFELPSEIKLETKTERGKPPLIVLQSHDKQLLGSIAAKIRALRKPEPYKGKGIKYIDEQLRRKSGKAAAKDL